MNIYEGSFIPENVRIGIVVARFNEFITSKLLGGALDTLKRHNVPEDSIDVAWVPGSFEIPLIAQKMAKSGKYDAVILNFANCDMVGHTGVFDAAVQAVETVDTCVGKVVEAVKEMGGITIITADHGNADKMISEDGSPFTAHTTNLVPLCVVGYDCKLRQEGGKLSDIVPTMLEMMNIPQPKEMTGVSLIVK